MVSAPEGRTREQLELRSAKVWALYDQISYHSPETLLYLYRAYLDRLRRDLRTMVDSLPPKYTNSSHIRSMAQDMRLAATTVQRFLQGHPAMQPEVIRKIHRFVEENK
jgi:hypothetical protein